MEILEIWELTSLLNSNVTIPDNTSFLFREGDSQICQLRLCITNPRNMMWKRCFGFFLFFFNTKWSWWNRGVVGFVRWKNKKKKIKKNRRTWPYNQHSMALRVMRDIARTLRPSMKKMYNYSLFSGIADFIYTVWNSGLINRCCNITIWYNDSDLFGSIL